MHNIDPTLSVDNYSFGLNLKVGDLVIIRCNPECNVSREYVDVGTDSSKEEGVGHAAIYDGKEAMIVAILIDEPFRWSDEGRFSHPYRVSLLKNIETRNSTNIGGDYAITELHPSSDRKVIKDELRNVLANAEHMGLTLEQRISIINSVTLEDY